MPYLYVSSAPFAGIRGLTQQTRELQSILQLYSNSLLWLSTTFVCYSSMEIYCNNTTHMLRRHTTSSRTSFENVSFLQNFIELQTWSKSLLVKHNGAEVLAQKGDRTSMNIRPPICGGEESVTVYGLKFGSISNATGRREVKPL